MSAHGRSTASITAESVAECLRELGVYSPMTPLGFPLPGGARVANGGGIAGNAGRWWIVEPSGRVLSEPCGSVAKLKTAIRRWIKGGLPRVTEPGFSAEMVHFAPPPGLDQVTLCGKADWLGEETGVATDDPATCHACKTIVSYVGGRS